MFWSKKATVTTEKTDETVLAKPVKAYDLSDEVMIHTMPSRYKEMHADGQQAQKTGMLILFGGVFVLFLAAGGVAWLLIGSKPSVRQPISPVADNTEDATSSEVKQPVLAEVPVSTPVIASTSEVLSSSSLQAVPATSSSSTEPDTAIRQSTSTPAQVASDMDNDGLFDPEEDLLGTNKSSSDSDGDTFADLAELLKGYNPAGAGKLTDNQAIAEYSNSVFSLMYPRAWPFKAIDNNSLIFTTPDNQMLAVSISDNSAGLTIERWYENQFQATTIEANQYLSQTSVNGVVLWTGIKSADGLTYYLMDRNKKFIAAINYNLGPKNTNDFANIFKVAVQSFRFK